MVDSRQFVESIGRGFKLLSIVCNSTTPLSLSELSKESQLSVSTIQRLTYTLQQLGLLDRDQKTKKFKIGPEMITLSFSVIESLVLKEVARPHMQQLSEQLDEVVELATLSGNRIIIIEAIKTQQILNVNTSPGIKIPAHATAAGKAILAFLPEPTRKSILQEDGMSKLTDNTITSSSAYMKELKEVQKRGFATALDEFTIGLGAVAAPIRGNTGDVLASLTVMAPTVRVTKDKLMDFYSEKVVQAAKRISFDVGFRN
jgi:DNA-binding IclR family transcriptional regulator